MKFFLNQKKLLAILLIIGFFFSSELLGNPGVAVKKTLVLDKAQFPAALKLYSPSNVYILYGGTPFLSKYEGVFLRSDTITNFKKFSDSLKQNIDGFRLIFESKGKVDSVWQLTSGFSITDKAYNLGSGLLKTLVLDKKGTITDEFIYNYMKKYTSLPLVEETAKKILVSLLREYEVYNAYDRNNYSVNAVWSLSIGINDYKGIQSAGVNCQSDAQSYNDFLKKKFTQFSGGMMAGTLFNEYVLLGNKATKGAIIEALKDIASKASSKDYFIFNFSGLSSVLTADSASPVTYFYPYNEKGYPKQLGEGVATSLKSAFLNEQLISLVTLQEYIQQIPAVNQLFISEAGPSEKFKTEFIRILMQNSPAVASLLNKNRVIIVPNSIGRDDVSCGDKRIGKGPINYFITSLDSAENVYDLFNEEKCKQVAYKIKSREYVCNSFYSNYFEIFFEKQFLRDYNEIFGDSESQTRGMKVKPKELQETIANLTGKHYALVVGTDTYKGKGWKKLSNPIKDARAVADELTNSYGFTVQLMEDKPMDTIYKAIREYYRIAQPNDQLVVYFAGHGDVDDELLDDGFIVCNDSKSLEDDPVRNTYIPYNKLQKMLNNIPAKQVLVLLDVCHGGTFDAKAFDNEKREGEFNNISNRNVLQFLKDKLPLQTRKFLSSVGSEPAFDGKAGRHSPFANLLLQVLREKGSGSNGIVTLSDINAVLQTASLNETAALKISPHMADFGKVDAFSEFIFIPVERPSTATKE